MTSSGPRQRRRALTLFEVIIAIALIAMLLGSLLSFFWQTLMIRDEAMFAADRTQLVLQLLNKLELELRHCVGTEGTHFPVQQFVGARRSLTFVTAGLPDERFFAFYRDNEGPPPRHDLREVTYALWVDPDDETDEGDPLVGGILRTERWARTPYESEEEMPEDEDLVYLRRYLESPEFGYLEFRYYDGVEWTTSWEVTQGNPLPQQVMIIVGFDSLTRAEYEDQDLDEYPLAEYPFGPDVPSVNRYQRIVRLPAADKMFASRVYRLGNEVEEIYEFMGPGGAADMLPAGLGDLLGGGGANQGGGAEEGEEEEQEER